MSAVDKAFNPQKYARLLAQTLPSVIRTEEENERVLAVVKNLLKKGSALTPEEEQILDLLSTLIEDFEEREYPIEPASSVDSNLNFFKRYGDGPPER